MDPEGGASVRTLKGQFGRAMCIAFALIFAVQMLDYMWFRSLMYTNTETLLESMIETKRSVIENYVSEWNDISNSICYQEHVQRLVYQGAGKWLDDSEQQKTVISLLQSMSLIKREIMDINLLDTDGKYVAGFGNGRAGEDIYTQIETGIQSGFSSLYIPQRVMGSSNPCMYFTMPIYKTAQPDFGKKIGMVVITFDVNELSKLIKEEEGSSQFILLDDTGRVVATARKQLSDGSAAAYMQLGCGMQYDVRETSERENIVRTAGIKGTGWTIVAIAPKYEFTSQLTNMLFCTMLLLFLGLTLLTILYFTTHQRVLKDVNRIIDLMSRSENTGSMPEREPAEMQEFQSITDAYCKLVTDRYRIESEVKKLIEKNHEAQVQAKQWEIDALRSQIRPHFLYNTLDNLRGMAIYSGANELAEKIGELARLLRYSVQPGALSTVGQEVEELKRYARIMEMRVGPNRIAITTECEAGVENVKLLRMLVQPLVENSIEHGLNHRMTGGMIKVRIERANEERLLIRVWDNGKGMDEKRISEVLGNGDKRENDGGIGLGSIVRCLRLMYDGMAELIIESDPGKYTEVKILIPYEVKKA